MNDTKAPTPHSKRGLEQIKLWIGEYPYHHLFDHYSFRIKRGTAPRPEASDYPSYCPKKGQRVFLFPTADAKRTFLQRTT